MGGLRVTEDELRAWFVTGLEVIEEAEFEQARRMAARAKIPLERALVERGRIPLGFLLRQLAESWGVRFVDLKVSDVQLEALRSLPEEYAEDTPWSLLSSWARNSPWRCGTRATARSLRISNGGRDFR